MFEVISKFIDYYNKTNKFFTYTYENVKHNIAINLIIYIKSEGKRLLIHTLENNLYVYKKLSDAISGELKGQFVTVRRGVAVNIEHITMSDFDNVTLTDKTKFDISRNLRNDVRERISYMIGGKQ